MLIASVIHAILGLSPKLQEQEIITSITSYIK